MSREQGKPQGSRQRGLERLREAFSALYARRDEIRALSGFPQWRSSVSGQSGDFREATQSGKGIPASSDS
jgi:hypothetical protein